MAARRSKGTIQSIVDAIGELLRQPLSDESNEVPSRKSVVRSKRAAAAKPLSGKAKPAKRKAKAKPRAKAKAKTTAKKPALRKKSKKR